VPGGLTPSLQEDLVRLSAWLPFARAAGELACSRRVAVSATTARDRAEAAGAACAAVQTAQAAAIIREAPPPPAGPARRRLSADGTMAPLVGGRWAAVTTVAIGEVGEPVVEGGEVVVHATALSYFPRLAGAATSTESATAETHRRGVEAAGVVCAVADGAEWIQGFVAVHRPDAVRILDVPHAAGYLGQVAAAVWPDDPARQRARRAAQRHELEHGAVTTALDHLQAVATGVARAGAGAAVREAVETSRAYLAKRREQAQYAAFLAAGYPIASGSVESAHTVVSEGRLGGAGMRWAPAHVDPMLALRTAAANDRWAGARPQIARQSRQAAQQRVAARRQARRPAAPAVPRLSAPPVGPLDAPAPAPALPAWRDAPPPATDPPGAPAAPPPGPARPAPDHPWRRPARRRRAAYPPSAERGTPARTPARQAGCGPNLRRLYSPNLIAL
jgi:hypothetical protein